MMFSPERGNGRNGGIGQYKETKGTYRFKPKDDSVIGNATIYLPKTFLTGNGIDPEKGLEMVIVGKE